MNWNYKHEESNTFELTPEGDHRVRIKDASLGKSKSGRDMLTLELEVNGSGNTLFHYIPFLEDYPEITNRNLTRFFDSFAINEGDFNVRNYIGHVGAARIKHEEYNGRTYAKVHYFIQRSKQDDLIPWGMQEVNISNDELPF